MANVVLKWLGNKLFNGTKMICSIKGNNVKVDKTNLGDLIDVNTEELEEDVERALLGNHVYSTTERVCGEWVDGSNIYEKTYSFESSITVGSSFTDLLDNTDNIKTIIHGWGVTVHGSVPMKFGQADNKILALAVASSPIDNVVLQYIKNEGE